MVCVAVPPDNGGKDGLGWMKGRVAESRLRRDDCAAVAVVIFATGTPR